MTDARLSQLGFVAVTQGQPEAELSQFVFVAVTSETPLPPDLQASEARVFSIFSSIASEEYISLARVFSVYNYSALQMDISAAKYIHLVETDDPVEISQARVFALIRGRVANPRLRAWTFTLDGHDFYVLRLGDRETLIYDVYSEQWIEWTGNDLPFWRPNTGINWLGAQGLANTFGSNVVVGDDTFGLLWFLDPKQPYDDHPDATRRRQQRQFERIVTGQVSLRGRNSVPCYGIFLSGDNYGLTGTTFTPGVTLETSDDQGRTFDVHDTITVPANYDQELPYEWLSLGQMNSPGRMFRVRDDGIFARIDSMEMNDDAG